jgi:DNA-directed RNA polymerase subunit N (RpoN/RPB10)
MSHSNIICTSCGMVIADEYQEVKHLYREQAKQLSPYDLNQRTVNMKQIFEQINKRRFQEKMPELSSSCCQIALFTNVDQEEFILPVSTVNQKTYPNLPLKLEPSHPDYNKHTNKQTA